MNRLQQGAAVALGTALAVSLCGPAAPASAEPTGTTGKPRVVVTTDPEKDDMNSLIRYLLFSDWFETRGLVITSSQYHFAGDGKGTRQWKEGRDYTKLPKGDPCPCTSFRWPSGKNHIQLALDAYAKVYPNLKRHDPGYPSPAQLRRTYAVGNIDFEGEMSKDTAGSELIKKLLLDNDPRPVYLLAWGGQNTIARALESIETQYEHTPQWRTIQRKVTRKTFIQASGDQDGLGATYIKPHWPGIRSIGQVFDAKGSLTYGAQLSASVANQRYYSPEWIRTNITSKGPLGKLYYTWGDGRQMVPGDLTDFVGMSGYTQQQLLQMGYFAWMAPQPKGSFLGEGDTYTYLGLLGNGVRTDRDTTWGSFSRAADLPWLMNEESARLTWSVTPVRSKANHAPVVRMRGPLSRSVRRGQVVTLRATATDPDKGQKVSWTWSQDAAVDTYPGAVALTSTGRGWLRLRIPADAKRGQTIHVLLRVNDNGTPSLARYQRVVLTVRG